MARDTLFISHATPEDNEFAIWLASRLEMLGYKTWIDKQHLLGGERMWQEIQTTIEYNAIKILFVYSKNIRDINGQVKSGIYDELSFAKTIGKKDSLSDFIIPLHIDSSSYAEIIGFDGVKQIAFNESWAVGLKELINKFEKQNIKKHILINNPSISSWYENEYLNCCKIINKEEVYFSSWWKIVEIPSMFYIHVFKNKSIADMIYNYYTDIPIAQISNNIVAFEQELQLKTSDDMFEHNIIADKIFNFKIDDIYNGIISDTFPTSNDIKIFFIYLLNKVFFKLMKSKDMRYYRFSNKTAFYLPSNRKFYFVNIVYPNNEMKTTKKKLGGKYYQNFWNYAISCKAMLSPFIGYSLVSHLVFTKDGMNIINDEKFQSSNRRSKAKRFFNPDWRDLLLAFIQNIKDENNEIKIKVSNNDNFIKLSLLPEIYKTNFGYIEPVVNDNALNEDNESES